MTIHERDYSQIPAQTIEVARQAFPKGNLYLKVRDEQTVKPLNLLAPDWTGRICWAWS